MPAPAPGASPAGPPPPPDDDLVSRALRAGGGGLLNLGDFLRGMVTGGEPGPTVSGAGGVVAAGLPLLKGLRGLRGLADEARGIRAFHGSPHDFERFDISKIGTGEGAQTYGHGIYFAEAEPVAKSYREGLSTPTVEIMGQPQTVPNWGRLSPQPRVIRRLADKRMKMPDATEDEIVAAVRADLHGELTSYRGDEEANAIARQLDILEAAADRGIKTTAGGKMYEVNLNVDPTHLLDWDKPLSQQSEHVRRVVGAPAPVPLRDGMPLAGGGRLRIEQDPDVGARYFLETGGKQFRLTRSDLTNLVGSGQEGKSAYQTLSSQLGGDPAASSALREAGIPGLRYFDQFSRGTGQGTSNYVMFRDDLIDILRKYGILAPLAGGAAVAGARSQVGTPPPVQAPPTPRR